tara:strand:+ start:837 stop:1088 length:252 start_codon:yes stop_codon:yes gene_type:complete
MRIYSSYKPPPEPPKELWLEIDLSKIRFDTKRDIDYVKNIIIRFNPELYTTINNMYKIHQKNIKAYLRVINKYDLAIEPIIKR